MCQKVARTIAEKSSCQVCQRNPEFLNSRGFFFSLRISYLPHPMETPRPLRSSTCSTLQICSWGCHEGKQLKAGLPLARTGWTRSNSMYYSGGFYCASGCRQGIFECPPPSSEPGYRRSCVLLRLTNRVTFGPPCGRRENPVSVDMSFFCLSC